MKPIQIRYFNDPVAVGVGRIGLKVKKFSVISLLVSGSLLPLLRYLIIGVVANSHIIFRLNRIFFGFVASSLLPSIILWDPRLDSLLAHPTGSAQ